MRMLLLLLSKVSCNLSKHPVILYCASVGFFRQLSFKASVDCEEQQDAGTLKPVDVGYSLVNSTQLLYDVLNRDPQHTN